MSKHVKILGTGCSKCKQTTSVIEDVIKEHSLDATVEKVEDIMKIMDYNVLSTPAVVVDEQLQIKGRIPTKAEILELLK